MHGGHISNEELTGTGRIVAPSAIPGPNTIRIKDGKAPAPIPHELTRDEIQQIQEEFAEAATRASAVGFTVSNSTVPTATSLTSSSLPLEIPVLTSTVAPRKTLLALPSNSPTALPRRSVPTRSVFVCLRARAFRVPRRPILPLPAPRTCTLLRTSQNSPTCTL